MVIRLSCARNLITTLLCSVALLGCGRLRYESSPDGALPDALVDAALPDAALVDAALPDAALVDAALPDAALVDAALPDAALSIDSGIPRTCLNSMAMFTPEGCVLPTPAPCTPFAVCPSDFACMSTTEGDRCVCTALSSCGPRCTSNDECAGGTPSCHLGACYERFSCHGAWTNSIFCNAGEVCVGDACVPSPPRGSVATGSACGSAGDCVSGRCQRFTGFPSSICVEECDRTADCTAGTCSLPSFGLGDGSRPICAPASVLAAACGGCSTEQLCSDESRLATCVESCRSNAECGPDVCHLSNGSAIATCQNIAIACAPGEFVIDVDSGRARACSTATACYVDADCPLTFSCMAWAYGGLRGVVQTCARLP